MGSLIRTWKTIPLPTNAIVKRDGTVTWTVKGKTRTGKLSRTGTVSVQVDTWTAEFTDETGKVKRISTKTKNRSVAEKILAKYETEIDRIKSGVLSRAELSKVHVRNVTLDDALEQFCTKMTASGNTAEHINKTEQRILRLCNETKIDTVAKIRREIIERWIASEIQKKILTPSSINHYITAIKSFVKYVVDIELLTSNPLKSIRKINEAIGQRKIRRSMTDEEVERLLQAAETRQCRSKEKASERSLVYRLLLGTGLRSTELSLLTPNQIDFTRNRLTVEAVKTKKKEGRRVTVAS